MTFRERNAHRILNARLELRRAQKEVSKAEKDGATEIVEELRYQARAARNYVDLCELTAQAAEKFPPL